MELNSFVRSFRLILRLGPSSQRIISVLSLILRHTKYLYCKVVVLVCLKDMYFFQLSPFYEKMLKIKKILRKLQSIAFL